jgi:translation initiation factor 5A
MSGRRLFTPPPPPPTPLLQIEEITTSKTGKHGHAKANYYGYDIFTGKRYEDVAPTTHNVNVPVVERTEYILTDINDDDVNEDGSIVSLMTEAGEQREDLRLGDGPEYKQLRAAFAEGSKEILVTVVSAMLINKIDPQYATKDAGSK